MVELSSCLWLPEDRFDDFMAESLTVEVFKLGGDSEIVRGYRTDREGYVGLPRVRGLKLISDDIEDRMSDGHRVRFRRTVTLREDQPPFVDAMVASAHVEGDFIAKAATGKGKTVCALAAIQRLGRSAVVVVDQENLLDQWVERCVEHLGMREGEVGIVRGPRLDYEGKAITICMMQTLTRRKMPNEFCRSFGTAVFDESHTAGAPTFSRALMMFDARVRFGLSATPKRGDALDKVIAWNLGSIGAELEAAPGRSAVYVRESEGVYSWRVNSSKMAGGFINEIADDGRRNLLAAEAIRWLYETGRDVLVIGDRVEHLCSLAALVEALGVPAGDLGLYAKSETVYRYEKDPRPPRQPEYLVRGAQYSPIRLRLVQKTIPKKLRDAAKSTARIVFATYGVMMKGVDIPRLSAGIDVTPRSEATQVLGRVLRSVSGKLKPIWVTIADVNSYRSLYQLSNRLSDYQSSNAEVFLWDPAKGRKRLDVSTYRKELAARISLLRRSRITTSLDGSSTLQTPTTPNGSASCLARRTGRSAR